MSLHPTARILNWYLLRSTAFLLIYFFGFGTVKVNFDNVREGTMPPYWTATETHAGPPPHWQVLPDKTAPSHKNVFAQVSTAGRDSEFLLAVYDRVTCKDGDLSVKFKITSTGKIRTAGIVWRYQDEDNYYLLHFSADQKNIVLFRVTAGKATPLPIVGAKQGTFGVSRDIHPDQWYVAKVTFRGPNIRVSFGNRKLFDAVDSGILRDGKTGLWTRAGTAAIFDDYRIDKKS